MAAVREKNSRLRVEGTRNLMAAAKAADVRRVVAQSIAFVYAPGPKPYREGDPLDSSEAQRMTIAGVTALEDAVLNTPGIDGVVLRYGRLYGPGTWFDKPGSAGAADDRCGGAGGAAGGDQAARPASTTSPRTTASSPSRRPARSSDSTRTSECLELRA